MGAVTGIHDGDGAYLRCVLCCSLDEMAHHDDVGIVGHHQDSVFQRLALRAAGYLWVGKAYDTGT